MLAGRSKENKRKITYVQEMQRRGGKEGEGMLSTDSIKWSKHAPIISK